MTAKHYYQGCQGKWKIFVLHLNVISENHKKIQPSNFQCSAQGTFHTNMQSSHFYLLKAFANCFHTLIWKGGSNTSFGLIKGKSNLKSFFGQLSLAHCSWQALLPHRHKKHGTFVCHFVAQPICTNSSNLLQIIQSSSSIMVPGTEYSDIGFYCSYRL